MYVRFAIRQRDADSARWLGIFQAAAELANRGALQAWEHALLREIRDWFDRNLEKPDRFTASKPPYYRKQSKAISWFKDTAIEHIKHAREMVAILEHHGILVDTYRAERVGYIVYEDKYQIVAEAFADSDC
jgi:hypothetical protein